MRKCDLCHKEYPDNRFSKQGKHTTLRKRVCIHCEAKKKKASKLGLDIDQYNRLMDRPCTVCGEKTTHIQIHEEKPIASLCPKCYKLFNTKPEILYKVSRMVYDNYTKPRS